MSDIAIIDYGAGNIASVKNMLKKVGAKNVVVTNQKEDILSASKILLPGVGHFDFGMQCLHDSGLVEVLEKKVVHQKIPTLGICLGAQLMTRSSEEGKIPGLGWVNGRTVSFAKRIDPDFKVPHMGWNYVSPQKEVLLFIDMPAEPRFYFVHSFFMKMEDANDVWLNTEYGVEFCSAFQSNNIYGCQFHPEKSHKFSMALMRNFVQL